MGATICMFSPRYVTQYHFVFRRLPRIFCKWWWWLLVRAVSAFDSTFFPTCSVVRLLVSMCALLSTCRLCPLRLVGGYGLPRFSVPATLCGGFFADGFSLIQGCLVWTDRPRELLLWTVAPWRPFCSASGLSTSPQ